MRRNEGWAIHLHHNILVEWCTDYKERKKYIIEYKRKNEIATRLSLFKLLPRKAVSEIPMAYQVAYKVWRAADEAWQEANKAYQEACKAWQDADEALREAYKAWLATDKACREADKAWLDADKAKFHAKWCGCKAWNGEKLIFGGLKK